MKCLAVALITGLAFCPQLAGQQPPPPHCAQNLFCLFNQEAAVNDSAGIHKYSEDLIGLLVPSGVSNGTRKKVIDALADRLARAEQAARSGQGKFVPEANVVRAFNEMMVMVGAPSSLRADEAAMRRFREHAAAIKAFPALFTADRNGTNCNPGEAVFLLYLLLSDNGVLYDRNLDTAQALMQPYNPQSRGMGFAVAYIGEMASDTQRLLSSYISGHKRSETIALFNNLADILVF